MLKAAIFRNSYNLSDVDASKSASLALITSDVDIVSTSLDILFTVLVLAAHIIIYSVFLWTLLGRGTLAVLALCAVVIVLGCIMLHRSGSHSQDTVNKTTARKLSTQDMMSNMNNIRLTSNVAAIKHTVTQCRNDELASVDSFGWGWSIPTCLSMNF